MADKTSTASEENETVEAVTRWGLVTLAALAALGALLRMFASGNTAIAERLDQTTLLYLAVAGGLLLLRQVKTFSFGQLKLEMIEKLREQQQKTQERLDDIALILPLLLPDREVRHIHNLFQRRTDRYHGGGPLRDEIRRLRSMGLVAKKSNRNVAEMRDGLALDLADYVELTDLGRRWATRIQEIDSAEQSPTGDMNG